jgi:hypothetical protein
MYEEKRIKICLFKTGNVVNSKAMGKFSNKEQVNFKVFNLCDRFFK